MHNKRNGNIDNRNGSKGGRLGFAKWSTTIVAKLGISHLYREDTHGEIQYVVCNLKHSERYEALNSIIASYGELCRESTIACADKTNCRHSIDE